MVIFQSLSPLAKTLCDLCSNNTVVLLSYEERTTGNKPLIEKRFFEVNQIVLQVFIELSKRYLINKLLNCLLSCLATAFALTLSA